MIFLSSQYFNIKPTPLSNRLAARRRHLDLFQQVGGASYNVQLLSTFGKIRQEAQYETHTDLWKRTNFKIKQTETILQHAGSHEL